MSLHDISIFIIIFRLLFSLFNKLLERMKKIKEFFIKCQNDIVTTGEFVDTEEEELQFLPVIFSC